MKTINERFREYVTVKSKYLALSKNATYLQTKEGKTLCLVRDLKDKNKSRTIEPIIPFDVVFEYCYENADAILTKVDFPDLISLINSGVAKYYNLPDINKTLFAIRTRLDLKPIKVDDSFFRN